VAIAVGMFWVFVCWHEPYHGYPPVSWRDWQWFVPIMILPGLWSVALIMFFGHDFVRCVLGQGPI
jgi:hypothetical protein